MPYPRLAALYAHARRTPCCRLRLSPDPLRGAASPQAGWAVISARCIFLAPPVWTTRSGRGGHATPRGRRVAAYAADYIDYVQGRYHPKNLVLGLRITKRDLVASSSIYDLYCRMLDEPFYPANWRQFEIFLLYNSLRAPSHPCTMLFVVRPTCPK